MLAVLVQIMGLDTHPSYVLAVGAAFLVLCPIIVSLRFYTRAKQRAGFGIDDWLTVPALLLVIGCAVNVIVGVCMRAYAYPTSIVGDEPTDYIQPQKFSWSFFLMQILSIGFIKLSFVFLYRRIFVNGCYRKPSNIISVLVAVIVVAWTLAFFFWTLFSCRTHFSSRWTTHAIAYTYCPTDNISNLALAISDVITDVIVLSLPIPNVLRLQMSISRKLAVLAAFGLGTLSIVASIIRLAKFVQAVNSASSSDVGKTIDIKLVITQGSYWPMLESGLALIACCLPVLHGLVAPLKRQQTQFVHQPSQITSYVQMRSKQTHVTSRDASTSQLEE